MYRNTRIEFLSFICYASHVRRLFYCSVEFFLDFSVLSECTVLMLCAIMNVYLLQVGREGSTKLLSSAHIDVDPEAGRLTFKSLNRTDQSRYSCHAINDVGVAKQDIELRVLGTF